MTLCFLKFEKGVFFVLLVDPFALFLALTGSVRGSLSPQTQWTVDTGDSNASEVYFKKAFFAVWLVVILWQNAFCRRQAADRSTEQHR